MDRRMNERMDGWTEASKLKRREQQSDCSSTIMVSGVGFSYHGADRDQERLMLNGRREEIPGRLPDRGLHQSTCTCIIHHVQIQNDEKQQKSFLSHLIANFRRRTDPGEDQEVPGSSSSECLQSRRRLPGSARWVELPLLPRWTGMNLCASCWRCLPQKLSRMT